MFKKKLWLILFILFLVPQTLYAQEGVTAQSPVPLESGKGVSAPGVSDIVLSSQVITQLAAENWKTNEELIVGTIVSLNPGVDNVKIVPQGNKLNIIISRLTSSGREAITLQTDPSTFSQSNAGKSRPIDAFDMNTWLQTQTQTQVKNVATFSNNGQDLWKVSVASQIEQTPQTEKPIAPPAENKQEQGAKNAFLTWMDNVVAHSSLLKDYRDGGPVMHWILFCSIAGVYVIIDRFLELRRKKIMPPSFLEGILTRLPDGKISPQDHDNLIQNLIKYCEEQNHPISRVLKGGLFVFEEENILGLETAVVHANQHEGVILTKGLPLLEVYANMAPLLGLLGTVTGMIGAFMAIAQSGTGKPEVVAAGIAEALLTTAFGLFVGIPLLVLFYYLQGKVDDLLVEMQNFSMDVIERLIKAEETAKKEY